MNLREFMWETLCLVVREMLLLEFTDLGKKEGKGVLPHWSPTWVKFLSQFIAHPMISAQEV